MSEKNKNLILIKKSEFKNINDKYRKLIDNPPSFTEDSPMVIYKWIESLAKLSKNK